MAEQPGDNPRAPQHDLAVILVAWKAAATLQRCLPTVMAHLGGVSTQVILVDNDSGDGTVEYVRATYPQIQVIEMGWNAGFARANNVAIEACSARHVLLLNTDVIFESDIPAALVKYLDAHPDVGAITPAQVDGQGQPLPLARQFPPWYAPLQGMLQRPPTVLEPASGAPDAAVEADWIPGGCMALAGEALRRVGPLDPRYFVFFEDVDWCARARRAGLRVQVLPWLRVIHLVGGGKRRSPEANRAYLEAEFLYHKLHHPGMLWFVRAVLLARQLAGLLVSLLRAPFDPVRRREVGIRAGLVRGLLTPGWTPTGER